ncbi:unnamed protein product [Protopolystoma xenopodis]|uniref:Uncharacterized protein n=1 Tax=Protopolystoma xenopodis TaxID=117903 RepID=A0A3S5AL81_9PLAT|nr:unnamed protein product [Protopolystoma xenopodis]
MSFSYTFYSQLRHSSGIDKSKLGLSATSQAHPASCLVSTSATMASRLKASSTFSRTDTVSKFLCRSDTQDLAWTHHLASGQYASAGVTLFAEGLRETRLIGRRKTLLSLSKLAQLAANAAPPSASASSAANCLDNTMSTFSESDLPVELTDIHYLTDKLLEVISAQVSLYLLRSVPTNSCLFVSLI